MHRRGKKLQKSFFPKCFTLCYKLCGWVVQSSFFQNVCFLEVSDLGSTGHFVDLDQENASVWSPPPEPNLEKQRPLLASGAAARRRGATNPSRTSDPGKLPPASHAPTYAGMK